MRYQQPHYENKERRYSNTNYNRDSYNDRNFGRDNQNRYMNNNSYDREPKRDQPYNDYR